MEAKHLKQKELLIQFRLWIRRKNSNDKRNHLDRLYARAAQEKVDGQHLHYLALKELYEHYPSDRIIDADAWRKLGHIQFPAGNDIQKYKDMMNNEVLPPPMPVALMANLSGQHCCPKCERVFRSQAALSGHGPDRCKGKR